MLGLRHIWHVTYSTMYFRRSDSMYFGTYLPVSAAVSKVPRRTGRENVSKGQGETHCQFMVRPHLPPQSRLHPVSLFFFTVRRTDSPPRNRRLMRGLFQPSRYISVQIKLHAIHLTTQTKQKDAKSCAQQIPGRTQEDTRETSVGTRRPTKTRHTYSNVYNASTRNA